MILDFQIEYLIQLKKSLSLPSSLLSLPPLSLQNDKGLVPADVVPDPMDMSLDKAEAAMVAKELKQLLLDAVPLSCNLPRATLPNYDNIPGNLMLSSLGLKLGERVLLDDMKVRSTLRIRDQILLVCPRTEIKANISYTGTGKKLYFKAADG